MLGKNNFVAAQLAEMHDRYRNLLRIDHLNPSAPTGELTVNMVGYYSRVEDEEIFLKAYRLLFENESDRYQYLIFMDNCPDNVREKILLLSSSFGKNVKLATTKENLGAMGCFIWGLSLCETPYYMMIHNDCLVSRKIFHRILERFSANTELTTIACKHPKGGMVDSWCITHPVSAIFKAIPFSDEEFLQQRGESMLQLAFSGSYPNKAKYWDFHKWIVKNDGVSSVYAMNEIDENIQHLFMQRYKRKTK